MVIQVSDTVLDLFAPRLSALKECNVPSVELHDTSAEALVLQEAVTGTRFMGPLQALVLQYAVRVSQAAYDYNQGKMTLEGYLKVRSELKSLRLYVHALSYLCHCLGNLDQARRLAARIEQTLQRRDSTKGAKTFERRDGSVDQRINSLYGASKHMEGPIAEGQTPDNLRSLVWLTNDGVASTDASITYREIQEQIIECRAIATELCVSLPTIALDSRLAAQARAIRPGGA
ncbi:MAG: hypothetical protein IT557_13235 [Alphaproteobacteria bacterium]|nr:hypothetical protein [Alphaproteobacteria bacterium]